jgi:hypothetical protein
MAEQFINLLEIGGPDGVAEALGEIPKGEARDLIASLTASGHPDETAVAELRELFAARMPAHPLAGVSRKRPRRRR